jgi:Domain of unknown function (DUF397)
MACDTSACVEVVDDGMGTVLVRSTNDPDRTVKFTAEEWAVFLEGRDAELTAERDRLREERDLAAAHDRQPYPTAEAYERACAALEKHRQRADEAEAEVHRLRQRLDEATRADDDDLWLIAADEWVRQRTELVADRDTLAARLAQAELVVEALRPVVDAAVALVDDWANNRSTHGGPLREAVAAYQATPGGEGTEADRDTLAARLAQAELVVEAARAWRRAEGSFIEFIAAVDALDAAATPGEEGGT